MISALKKAREEKEEREKLEAVQTSSSKSPITLTAATPNDNPSLHKASTFNKMMTEPNILPVEV